MYKGSYSKTCISLICCTLFIATSVLAQWTLKGGLEYRITPIDISNKYNDVNIFQSRDELLTGVGLDITVETRFLKSFKMSLSTHFRYDHLYYDRQIDTILSYSIGKSIKNLFVDYQFLIGYNHVLSNKNVLGVAAGIGLMGRESEYSVTSLLNGGIRISQTRRAVYDAFIFKSEYEVNELLAIGLKLYYVFDHPFIGAETFVIPALNIQYRILKS